MKVVFTIATISIPCSGKKINSNFPGQVDLQAMLSVDPTGIFAAETVALLSRTAARDLYDGIRGGNYVDSISF